MSPTFGFLSRTLTSTVASVLERVSSSESSDDAANSSSAGATSSVSSLLAAFKSSVVSALSAATTEPIATTNTNKNITKIFLLNFIKSRLFFNIDLKIFLKQTEYIRLTKKNQPEYARQTLKIFYK